MKKTTTSTPRQARPAKPKPPKSRASKPAAQPEAGDDFFAAAMKVASANREWLVVHRDVGEMRPAGKMRTSALAVIENTTQLQRRHLGSELAKIDLETLGTFAEAMPPGPDASQAAQYRQAMAVVRLSHLIAAVHAAAVIAKIDTLGR